MPQGSQLRPHSEPRAVPSARPVPLPRAVGVALLALTLALGGMLLWSAPTEAQAVSGLGVVSAGPTQATATVPVVSAGTVHLRFALAGTGTWNSLSATASAPGTVEISLIGLTPNSFYNVQASQDSSFPGTAATQSVTFNNRPAHLDIALDHDNPWGIWGNASTLWVVGDHSGPANKRLYAYNRSDGSRYSSKDFDTLSDAGNNRIGGIWSDGTTMFVVDWDDDKVFAYGLSTRQPTAGADLDLDGSNDNARGIWGNASTLWVADDHDSPDNKLYAYNRSDGSRDYAKDFDTLNSAGNQSIKGIWSDGSTMFVADFADKKLYGYHMGSKQRWARQDIDLVPENGNPKGVWGDGGKLWVANDGFGSTTKIFAYYAPVVDTVVSDISLPNVTGTSATATVWIAASDGTARTVHLRHREEASAAWTNAPSQMAATASTEFTLTGLSAGARYVVQASFDSTFSEGAEVTVEFQARPQDQDFRLAKGNGDARGIWSDGSTLWVVNDGSGDTDRVYAYTVSTKAHDAGNSFDLNSGNTKPGGMYANASVMWVPDGDDDSVYAYTIASGNSYGDVDTSKGFALHTGADLADIIVPTGAWSDGSILWVTGHAREQVYAYNIGSTGTFGARDTSKECDLATDYASPRGTWSDGSTLWVADSAEDRVFAYGITSGDGCGERQPLREIRLVNENSDPWGIWSNGTTLWVADAADDKVYAYTLPAAPSGDVTGVALDRITRTEADIIVTLVNPDAAEKSVEILYEAVPGGEALTSTASTSDTSVEFNLTGLTESADYTLRVRVDRGGVARTGGFRTQSDTNELREYLKNSIVGTREAAHPWLRETYNAMRRHYVPVVASGLRDALGLSGLVRSSCFLAVGSELSKCFIREFQMDDRSLRHLGNLIHELAHVHTIGSGYADEPAEYLGMGWLYFRDLAEGGSDCDTGEMYAEGIEHLHESASQYYHDQCSNTGNMPSGATIEVVESILAGQTPDWFRDEYEGDGLSYDTSTDPKYDRAYDLKRVWHDLLLLDGGYRDAAVYQFRNAFGGYCDPTEAYQAAFESGPTRIPWKAGGCVPQAPGIDAMTGIVGGLTVGWSAPATDGDAAVTSYDLRYIKTSLDESEDSYWTVETGVWSSGDLTATVTGLELGTQYDVQVRAVNTSGEGPWSTTRMGTTLFSDDAMLTRLTLTGIRLTPRFASGVTSYAGAVGYTVTRTTVAATTSDVNAAVAILDVNGNTLAGTGTADADLSVGENVFLVRVTAQDDVATETYTVTVTRTGQDLSLTAPVSAPVAAFASTAVYTVEFRGGWTAAVTADGVPSGAHFSRLIAAVHNAGVTFVESGAAASPGVESMAEIGGTSILRSEVTSAGPNALGVVRGDTSSIGPTATNSLTLTLTTGHPLVTLVTMIAPSPDWFVGVSGLSLLDPGGNWLSSHEVRLYPWDAGTENGDEFSLSNPATSPRGVITSIRGTGKFSTENIATLKFTLESVNLTPTGAPFITGAPEVGEELMAHTSAIADADGLASPGYSYQWLRVDSGGQAANISGATSATYAVQAADVGKRLAVRVSFVDDEDNAETLTSDATEGVIVAQVTVSFEATAYQAEEGGQPAAVTVVLDKEPHRTLVIPLHGASGGGADPSDYTAPSQVTFGAGETAKDGPVSAREDSVDDDGESVTLSFGDLPNGVSAGSPSETVVRIVDNDYVPVTLGWEQTAFTAEEPTSPGALTPVTLHAVAVTATDKRPESDFSFDFTVNTANGTARQPGDYERLSTTGTFDRSDFFRTTVNGQFRWVASKDFTVNVVHDTVDEPSESFSVRLAFAGSRQPHLTLGDSTATVTTTDDVASLADLLTTVLAGSSAVDPGGQLTYDWSVSNSGPAASTNTVLTGTLDASVIFASAQVTSPATGQCRRSGRTVTCTFGTLELGGAASGQIVVEVQDDASADIRLTAVAAADQLDRTPADNSETVTTALDAPPRQITDLRATAAGEHIDLAWSAPDDNGSAISRYELQRKTGTTDFVPVFPSPAAVATSHRDEDVEEGTGYTYRLRAVNDDGEAGWSNEATATVDVNEPPEFTSGSLAKTSFSYPENRTSALYTYKASDPEGGAITWSLSGEDRDDLSISEVGVLSFAQAPDFEFPADADRNNEYLVTVEARDDRSNVARLEVIVNVTNAAGTEEPTITTTGRPSLTFRENGTGTVYTYRATDPQRGAIAWSVTGTDADDFSIGSGGELTFASPPDFENPTDVNGDNVYELTVGATDEQGLTDRFDVTVAVTNHAEGVEPTISTRRPPSTYRENGTSAVYTFRASDPQRQTITWTLDGADRGDFTFTPDSSGRGVLAFSTPPDFEIPADSDGQNDYELTVIATDEDGHADRLSFIVAVTDVNEGPEISRVGSAPGSVPENYDQALARYSAADPEGSTVAQWRTSGTDGGDFVIDERGEVRFRNTPDHERPADSNLDNVYVFTVQASDGRVYGSFEETVTVTPVNEAPTITTTGGSATELRQDENRTSRLYTYRATDPERETFTWSVGGVDGHLFAIDERGQFSFRDASPPDFEQPGDLDGNNVYEVAIQATDDRLKTASLPVTVTVREVNEGPEITGRTGFTISENQGLAGASYTAVDPEDPGGVMTRWSLTGRDAGDFAIDESGQVTFRSLPDYERPADSGRDNVYEVTVRASDGRNYGHLEVTVTVEDVNEPPVVTGTDTFTFRENDTRMLHTFRATDPEGSDITWAVSGDDGGHFAIYQGMLTLKRIPNFENPVDDDGDNVYEVTVVARDDAFNSGTLAVTVTVTDQNEGPEISGQQSLSFTENQATDRVLATYSAADPEDTSATISRWSLTGHDAGDFTIDESGRLTFRNVPDYERPADSGRDNMYELTIRASDGRLYGYLEVAVTVEDVNEAPSVTGTETFTYRENRTATLHTFRAVDPERSVPTWSLQGPDDDHFTIGETGVLAFTSPPDHESPADLGRDNVYDVTIVARDDAFNSGTLDVTVTVTDQNEGPEITGQQTLSFTENQATDRVLAFYTAADPEDPGAAITRWSVTGRDAGDFAIDENGWLTFRKVPDYERPADSGRDNVYNLSVRASDGRYYGYLEVMVTVEAVNEAPSVTGTETFNYRENGTAALYTFRATDPERSAVTWSLSGADEDDFAIGETGVLAFARPPDYEGPTDSDGDNVYEVTVVARDDAFNSGTLDVVVTVTYQDEGPEISGLQGLSFTENQATDRVLATYTGRDPEEPSALITLWSLTGHDAGDFRIDESGRLTFRKVPDYERPADSKRDNIYEVTVRASDGRNYGYLEVTLTVEDVNEPPAITGTETFNYRENGTATLHAFRAADPERSAIEWSLSGPDDDDFSIGENGVLSFASPPDYERPADSGRDNVYNVTIVARDDAFNPGTLDITVTVTDQNEGPEVSGVQSLSFTENQATDRVLAFYSATDPEEPSALITRWSLTGPDAGDFTIDENGQMTFRRIPDYERPADSGRDNMYEVTIRASDGRYYGYLEVTLTVEDVNESPTVTGTDTFTYRENGTAALYTFRAADPERSAITWSLSGADADDFTIGETGVLSFAGPPNYESPADSGRDNMYEVTVEARDDFFNTGTLEVTVTVTDVNEGPEISGRQSLSFTENQATDRVLAFYNATDPEDPSALISRWSLTGRDAGDFAIDENGQLTFRKVPDYERPADSGRDNMYEVTVRASDGRYYGYFEVTVTVEDVNEPPLVTGTETFNYRENGTANLYTFRAADPERGVVTWSLSGADDIYFTIGETGVLSFASPPDYENAADSGRDNVYEVTIVARDDAFNSGTLDVAVTVTDVNEGPEITGSVSLSFTENQATDRVLATYTATDPEDPADSITRWSLSGRDRGDFAIDENGQLTFRNVPDHERPADSGKDNEYNLSVRASDGRNYGYLEVTVSVEDVNEAPAVTGTETFSYRENGTAAVYTFRAADPEGSAITWSLSGADDDDFTIGETGVLSFASPPEYESPADSGRDNVYDVTIVARDDAFNSGTLDVAVTVTDQNEGPEIAGQQSLSFTENQATDRVLATYTATDPEDPSALITRWSLTGADAGDFRIDENGQLTFRNVPDYERSADSGKDNEYNFSVRASDGRYYGHLVVTVTVQDVNEAPAITTTGKTEFTYRENGTAAIYTFKAQTPSEGPSNGRLREPTGATSPSKTALSSSPVPRASNHPRDRVWTATSTSSPSRCGTTNSTPPPWRSPSP